ncbi:F0F1 ATP synthase subunit delta [Hazenella coriacea]|uniref:ATP synthase subunit delta n=1 Tax=Hazenella coriacea TaxID=1179467 RepID=A0A4R3L751_9BACL|nr:F0F1 ATP synthase subunit delta [Hazenella coriacea]TCS95593.1 ATP synthase F1 subcomplex delta subunit [Hazenella coriacea]
MNQSIVAKRYAKALFEVALEKKLLDVVEKDLAVVVETLSANPELVDWLNHPMTDATMKKALFQSAFAQLNEVTRNFLFLLADRHRETILSDAYVTYRGLVNQEKGVAEAVVTTAFPLSNEDKQQLVERFQPIVGKELHIMEKVDSDILGGVIVQVGDRLYDGSLRTSLNHFRDRLKESRIG